MELGELLDLRETILDAAKGPDGFIEEPRILNEVLPLMLDAKLVDSEDFNNFHLSLEPEDLKISGYVVNETGERLQIFLVDETFVREGAEMEDLFISEKAYYERQFRRATRFVRLATDGSLVDKVQDSDPIKALIGQLASATGIDQFDVIEIFLVSLSATVSHKAAEVQPREIHFDKDSLKVVQKIDGRSQKKDILLLRRIVDLNFIHGVNESRGNREPLTVDFKRDFDAEIEVIKAGGGSNFESYLCVLDASVLFNLYRLHSSRLLEKNVRSFLQFKGVNRGLRETIRENPEKFIAYNNGLTITSTEARLVTRKKRQYLESLKDFQIVNGGQTTASIYFSKKDGLDISQVRVMAKINVVKGGDERELDELISKVSRYSNTQSRVSNVDLRARNPQLVQLKTLSNSVMTPSGKKWFFERAKGEFNTQLRQAGGQKAAFKRKFPPDRRFSKEQLAKYYTAWSDVPYMVKKGGEKVFRHFIEELSPEDEDATVIEVDRTFYEELVAKIILFRSLEKIYGQGKNAMGQIRSAAIPYALSSLYTLSDGGKDGFRFDMGRIWKHEGLEDNLRDYLRNLLLLINDLIKKYSMSDDYGEYSKKQELWDAIRRSSEFGEFMTSSDSKKILNSYTTPIDQAAINIGSTNNYSSQSSGL